MSLMQPEIKSLITKRKNCMCMCMCFVFGSVCKNQKTYITRYIPPPCLLLLLLVVGSSSWHHILGGRLRLPYSGRRGRFKRYTGTGSCTMYNVQGVPFTVCTPSLTLAELFVWEIAVANRASRMTDLYKNKMNCVKQWSCFLFLFSSFDLSTLVAGPAANQILG